MIRGDGGAVFLGHATSHQLPQHALPAPPIARQTGLAARMKRSLPSPLSFSNSLQRRRFQSDFDLLFRRARLFFNMFCALSVFVLLATTQVRAVNVVLGNDGARVVRLSLVASRSKDAIFL